MLLHTQQFLPAEFLPTMKMTGFKLLFCYLMSLGMVELYVLVFEPLLPVKEWVKGSLFSLLPRAVNGFIVLLCWARACWVRGRLPPLDSFIFLLLAGYSGCSWAGCMRDWASTNTDPLGEKTRI